MKKIFLILILSILFKNVSGLQIPPGGVLISSANGVVAAPATTNVVYDRVNNFFGLRISTPNAPLHVSGEFRLGGNTTYSSFSPPTAGNSGVLSISNFGISAASYISINDAFSSIGGYMEIGRTTNNVHLGNNDSDTVTASITVGLPNASPVYSEISRAPGIDGHLIIKNGGTGILRSESPFAARSYGLISSSNVTQLSVNWASGVYLSTTIAGGSAVTINFSGVPSNNGQSAVMLKLAVFKSNLTAANIIFTASGGATTKFQGISIPQQVGAAGTARIWNFIYDPVGNYYIGEF